MKTTTFLDYAVVPFFVAGSMAAAWALHLLGVPNLLVTPAVVGSFTLLAVALERVRPEWPARPRDLPLALEAAHFLFNFEFGYGLALAATALLQWTLRLAFASPWPTHTPVAAQLLLAVLLYEGASYWQHRLLHTRASWWRFHALHHAGARLDLIRAARFHFVDFGTAAFVAFLPLAILGTPDLIVTLLAVLVSVLGLVQHGNIRARTPRWLDLAICTPAVHRRHHLRGREASDANFANTVMFFDHLFGSYGAPLPSHEFGTDGSLPAGFWAQLLEPIRFDRSEPSCRLARPERVGTGDVARDPRSGQSVAAG